MCIKGDFESHGMLSKNDLNESANQMIERLIGGGIKNIAKEEDFDPSLILSCRLNQHGKKVGAIGQQILFFSSGVNQLILIRTFQEHQ